jgi:hypothetical protein
MGIVNGPRALVILAQLEAGVGQGQIPGDRAEHGREGEGHDADAREARRERDVSADDRKQAPDKDGWQAPPLEEPIRQPEMPRGEADAPARPEEQRFAVALDQQVGDQRSQEVAGARGNDDADERKLPLRGECASKGNDDLAGNRDAGTFHGHGQEYREQAAGADDLNELLRHSAKPSS